MTTTTKKVVCGNCGLEITNDDDGEVLTLENGDEITVHRTGECGPADENGPGWMR